MVKERREAEAGQDSRNYTPPGYYRNIRLERKVSQEDIMKQELSLMPGFRFTWHYTTTEEEVLEPEDKFYREGVYSSDTQAFIRKMIPS